MKVPVDLANLGLPAVVSSVCDVQGLLCVLQTCNICIGHPDDKYHCLLSSRKDGYLLDVSGKFID